MQIEDAQNTTRTERRKAIMKNQIVESALRVFEESGYTKSTVNDITSRADVGHGTFYKYFKNKQDLLGILADDLIANVDEHINPKNKKLDVWERLYNEALGILEFYANHRIILLTLKEAMVVDKQFEDRWIKIHEILFKRIEHDIKGSMKKGYCRDIDVNVTIIALSSMLEGYAHHVMMHPPGSVDIDAAALAIAQICYHGVFNTSTELKGK